MLLSSYKEGENLFMESLKNRLTTAIEDYGSSDRAMDFDAGDMADYLMQLTEYKKVKQLEELVAKYEHYLKLDDKKECLGDYEQGEHNELLAVVQDLKELLYSK